MKRAVKKTLIFSFLFAVGVGLYLYKLHTLALEGNKLFGERCAKVNPPLIAYKTAFLNFSDAVKNPDKYSTDQGVIFFTDYQENIKKYVDADTEWLAKDIDFIERWDSKLVMPWYLKKGAKLQYEMYRGYRDHAKAINDITIYGEANEQLTGLSQDAVDRRDMYSEEYAKFSDEVGDDLDWRWRFMQLPAPSECTPENTFIPNTVGAFEEPIEVPAESKDTTG